MSQKRTGKQNDIAPGAGGLELRELDEGATRKAGRLGAGGDVPLNLVTIKFKKTMRRKARFGEVRKESGWLKQNKTKQELKKQAKYPGVKSLVAKEGVRRT